MPATDSAYTLSPPPAPPVPADKPSRLLYRDGVRQYAKKGEQGQTQGAPHLWTAPSLQDGTGIERFEKERETGNRQRQNKLLLIVAVY